MVVRFAPLTAALLALSACATAPVSTPIPAPPLAQPTVSGPSTSLGTGMVSAADPRAAAAGAQILRAGGSATDAALATLVALTVVEPQSSGIGGGGFLIHGDAAGEVESFDGREKAPMAAGGDWFFVDGKPLDIGSAIPGGRSVGVPGNIRMMALAHGRHGKLPWRDVFTPAIALARDGFVMTRRMSRAFDRARETAAMTAEARAIFYLPDGSVKPVGTLIRNPGLAAFLESVAARGPDEFYLGTNADKIVEAVNSAERNPSKMTKADVAAYQARQRGAVCADYRRHRICSMGPPSSGATTMLAILKQLERFDLAALGPSSPVGWHLFAESNRLAFADRDKYLGDPDFVDVPVAGLIDPGYLGQRSALIALDRTMASPAAGSPRGAPAMAGAGQTPEEAGTSHFVAVDRAGNVVSLTSTIESAFGSGLMVDGYYLNNELTDLSIVPEVNGVPVANRVEPGKRPRSSMTPTIVYGPDGRVRLAVGAAGGATIIPQVAKAIIAVIDWNLSAQEAINLPVVYSPGDTLYIERGTAHEAMIPALTALGHKVATRPESFKANAIEWKSGAWVGAADRRSDGAAVQQ